MAVVSCSRNAFLESGWGTRETGRTLPDGIGVLPLCLQAVLAVADRGNVVFAAP